MDTPEKTQTPPSGAVARRLVPRLVLACIAFVLAMLLSEGILRVVVDPVDYLLPELTDDDILGHRVMPHSGDHDAWGYRNIEVPREAQVVMIGDSQTYGIAATRADAWPAQLGRCTGLTTYSLALGGYGPIEYEYLLKEQALSLKPAIVIVGLYLGNDILDAFNAVYLRPALAHLRAGAVEKYMNVEGRSGGEPSLELDDGRAFGGVRDWLSRRSIFYRSTTFLVKTSASRLEMKLCQSPESGVVFVRNATGQLVTGLTPVVRLRALQLTIPSVREGLRLSCDALVRMNELCSAGNVTFMVILIPTKETVYCAAPGHPFRFSSEKQVRQLAVCEAQIRDRLIHHLETQHIQHIDLTPQLARAAVEKQIYPGGSDGHPNRHGYRVIAETIASHAFRQ